jgi:3-hydroxyisobutyrate dehydrogenase-like beta-hydroxyacid dehydrogenase
MSVRAAFIGFGEVASAFAVALSQRGATARVSKPPKTERGLMLVERNQNMPRLL